MRVSLGLDDASLDVVQGVWLKLRRFFRDVPCILIGKLLAVYLLGHSSSES